MSAKPGAEPRRAAHPLHGSDLKAPPYLPKHYQSSFSPSNASNRNLIITFGLRCAYSYRFSTVIDFISINSERGGAPHFEEISSLHGS